MCTIVKRKISSGIGTLLGTIVLVLTATAMQANASPANLKQFVIAVESSAGKILSDSQSMSASANTSDAYEKKYGVSLLEEFRADELWYQVLSAKDESQLYLYLDALGVKPSIVKESLFLNSPVLGGGPKAGEIPRDGHSIYVIERQMPGAGNVPLEKKTEISVGSQSVIEGIGNSIEWDHSYMTDAGTFCVFRTNDEQLIYEHGKIAGVPVDKVKSVEHLIYGHDFGEGTL